METGLQIIENPKFGKVRFQMIDGDPWFSASDVCNILGFGNSRDAISRHCEKDDVVKTDTVDSLGRKNQMTFINESGIYSLIFGSTLPIAKEFKRWVTSEVLPSIRKNGAYLTPAKANEIALGNQLIKAIEDLKENAVTQKTVALLVAENTAKEKKLQMLLRDYREIQEQNQHLYEENQSLQEKANLSDYCLKTLSEILAEQDLKRIKEE